MSANVTKDMKKVVVRLDDVSGDPRKHFDAAKSAAERAAGKDAVMIAWRDQVDGHFSPCVDGKVCDTEAYWDFARKSHEADLWVDVENGRYVFLFKTH